MRTLVIISVLLFSLILGVPSYSADFYKGLTADFYKGLTAAQNGDYATALKKWKPIAEAGNAVAQFNLGLIYEKGLGVLQDDKEAVRWYRLAAVQGDADAQTNLGVRYQKGLGVPQDDKEAVRWYRLAAEQGDADAQYYLGVMYALGKGVIKDFVYAHMWGNITSMNGYILGADLREIIEKKMSPSQIEEAQRLARECVKKNYKGC